MTRNAESPLVVAVRTLTEDLERFEALGTELERLPLNSDKALQRARQTLRTCADQETKLAASLREFVTAMQGMQAMQARTLKQAADAAARVQERQAARAALDERLAQLGVQAREVADPGGDLADAARSGADDVLGPLAEVERRLDALIDEAGQLHDLARTGNWIDTERDTQALQEQLRAIRNRVLLSRRKLASAASS